jgi:uncharacterized OB-fold protein
MTSQNGQRVSDGAVIGVRPVRDLSEEAGRVMPDDEGRLRLVGSRCRDCLSVVFPPAGICLECGSTQCEEVALAAHGVLYSFSTVHVSAARPTPYTIGYVDLEDGVRVLAPIENGVAIWCDMPARLLVSADGSYVCEPVQPGQGAMQ